MIDTKALREKVLDLAIRGKLVPQDPNDEPASVLLERIRIEKEQMVKEGKLKSKDIKNDTIIFKADDNLHYEQFRDGTVKCIEEEIPFDLPDGWSWERMGNISSIARGGSPRPIKAYLTTEENCINWIKIGDTEKDGKYIFSTKEKIKPEGMKKSRYVQSGDFLLTNSMSFGRPYILKTDGCIHDGWLVIGNIESIFNQDYLYYALSANFMYQTLSVMANGSTVDNLNSDLVKALLFPIPPMNEQIRIARKVEELLTASEIINENEEVIVANIKKLKTKILDLAIRGKLVPQNPDDEPASVLLERIQAEKEELIKQGKIKRDRKESVIFKGEDNSYYEKIGDTVTCINSELPFEIPNNWIWCRLQSICEPITDGTHQTPVYSDNGYVFLSAKNVTTGTIDWDNVMYIPESLHNELYSRIAPQKGDILLAKNGTIGVAAIVDRDCEFDIYVTLALLRTVNHLVSPHYLLRAIGSATVQSFFKGALIGIGVPNLHLVHIRQALIPIPPFAEQKRISNEMEKIFDILSDIEKSLS